MESSTIDGYATALLAIARAEGEVERLVDEIYRAATAVDGDTELREALADPQIPLSRKQGVVEALLGQRASATTVAAINLLVGSGQAKHLSEIASRLAELAAEQEGAVVAEVRSAVELDASQIERLETALSDATGRKVEVKAVVDGSVLGGVVAKVGDRVFDGTVKSRIDDLREQWG